MKRRCEERLHNIRTQMQQYLVSPRESFLHELDVAPALLPHSRANAVGELAWPADTDAHAANLGLAFLLNKS